MEKIHIDLIALSVQDALFERTPGGLKALDRVLELTADFRVCVRRLDRGLDGWAQEKGSRTIRLERGLDALDVRDFLERRGRRLLEAFRAEFLLSSGASISDWLSDEAEAAWNELEYQLGQLQPLATVSLDEYFIGKLRPAEIWPDGLALESIIATMMAEYAAAIEDGYLFVDGVSESTIRARLLALLEAASGIERA